MSLISLGLTLLFSVLTIALAWYCVNNTFHGKLFYYRLLKLRAISGKTSVGDDGWTKAENTLGGDFKKFIPAMDPEEFENSRTYLTKSGDIGRKPLPFWLIAVIGILITAEGLGFSYLLGTFIAPEGTADTYTLLMVALVLVLCVVLGVITHAAGHQLYRTTLINTARVKWQQARTVPDSEFQTQEVALHHKQNKDDKDSAPTQLVNRVGDSGKYTMVIVAVVAIVAIAGLSTHMRMKAHEKAEADRTMGLQVSAESSNPFAEKADGLPAAVTAPNKEANEDAARQVHDAGTAEATSAFITLAVIFVITQIVAIYAGYKWGFAGKEGSDAYKRTRGFSSWAQVREVREAFVEPVEELMTGLHARFGETNRKLPVHSFKQYLAKVAAAVAAEEEQADHEKRRKEREKRARERDQDALDAAYDASVTAPAPAPAPTAAPAAAPAPAPAPNPTPAPAPTAAPAAAAHDDVQAHLDALDGLQDKGAKERYVLDLEAGLRGRVIQAVKARQQREAAAREVEGLF